jgi:MFS family permease
VTEAAPAGATRVVVALGITQTLAWASSYYIPAVLAVPMARSLGLASSWVFGAFSAALVLSAVIAPWVGRAIDRRGGRVVLTSSNVVLASGLVLLAAAQGPVLLTVGWLVMGVGISMGLYDAAFATLAGLYGRAARGPITGITLIAGFASTVGWPVSAVLEDLVGWRGACLAWAGLHLMLGLPLNRFLVPAAPPPAKAAAAGAAMADGPPPPRFAMPLLAVVFATTWFVAGALAAQLPVLLQAAGASASAAIAAGALIGPAQVGARILEFSLLRRFHPLMSARLATLCHPIGAVLLAVFGAPAAAIFVVAHGMGNGVLTIAKGTLPLAVFGPVGYGARTGLISAPARLLQATAPFLFGLVLENGGADAALALTSSCCLLAFGALLLLRAAPAVAPKPA